MVEPVSDALRSAPAIAPPPARQWVGSDLWRMMPYLMPYRVRWIAMVVVAITSLGATVAIPLMTKAVIDGPVRQQDQHGLWVLGAAAMGVGITEAVLWFIRRWLVARATMGVEADIRKDLYAQLQILPMSFHGRWQSGQLLSRIMNDLGTIRRFMSFGLVFLILNGLQIAVVTAILLAMYWPLGVVVLASIVPITLTVLHFEQEYTRLSRLAQDQSGHVATHVEEAALGVRVVKSFGREDYSYDRFDKQLTDLYDTQVSRVTVSAKFWTVLEIIPNLTLIVVLGFGAYAAGHGYVTMGTLVAFITMMLSLVWPIASLGFLLSMTQESFTAANRIAEIFDAPREITDGPRDEPPRGGRLELVDVGFRFPDATPDDWALRDVTLTVEPGETLALVGSTGSGKSVLAALLSRLYDVTEGSIRIDGQDIRELSLPALRAGGGHRVRGSDAVLDVGRGEPAAWPSRRDRGPDGPGHRDRRSAVRLRPAVRAGHPHRRAGHEPVRRAAAAAVAGARDPGRTQDPGARRHPVRAGRAHRGRRRGGAAACAAPRHRHRRGPPGVDGAAGRQGGAAQPDDKAAPSPTSVRTPNCWPGCRSTAICWPPTTNSTTAPSVPVRGRTTRIEIDSSACIPSRASPKRRATEGNSCHRRSSADDHHRVARSRQGRPRTTTCPSTRTCRGGARRGRCSARYSSRSARRSRCLRLSS